MTSTEKVTTAVEQALFRLDEDGTASVVASSLESEQVERGWLGVVQPHLGFPAEPNSTAFSYHVFAGGFAAMLRRGWDPARPTTVEVHALLGLADGLTPAAALSTSDWTGWLDAPPAERALPRLWLAQLRSAETADRLRARALSQGDMLARSLAWLLQSPATPLGLVGCPDEDRIAILWALLAIAGPELPRREWTFATGGDAAAITFFDTPPPATDRIVVDLRRGQGASPQNEYRANALVYRYEYGVDPPGMDAPPTPEPVAPPAEVVTPYYVPATPATLPQWRAVELVRDVVTARDVRALDGALVELEYAVGRIDDRDEVRKALAAAGWAVRVVRRRVPFDLRDPVFDRVARIAFGATGPGRVTPSAHADARRLAADGPDDLVRAIARAGAETELADVLAQRWLAEHEPSAQSTGIRWRHLAVCVIALVMGVVLGMVLGGVLR